MSEKKSLQSRDTMIRPSVALSSGTRLGHYEIVASIGAGGMGEVYRARDSRLERDVAIKILPQDLAKDPVRLARFEREARLTASLRAPGIVTVLDIGKQGDTAFLVCELIEGRSLRQALSLGAFPLRKAFESGALIADALGAAHRAGIVHRDLKPENVMISNDGQVKILDFGLARAISAASADETATASLTLTAEHTILGSVGYMSPEQVRGGTADHRSDIFSLGAILYEMISGRRAFSGATVAEIMAATLKSEPDELAGSVPEHARRIVRRCLEKEPRERFDSAVDLAFALRNVIAPAAAAPERPALGRRTALSIVAALIVTAAAATALWLAIDRDSNTELVFTPLATDPGVESSPAFSPDGTTIAYIGPTGLFVRALDSPVPTQLTAAPAREPFWSPDGARIYYADKGSLYRISPAGGAAEKLLDGCRAAAISPDGKVLVFWAAREGGGGWAVSSPPGGPPTPWRTELPEPSIQSANSGFSHDGSKLAILDRNGQGWLASYPSGSAHRIRGAQTAAFLAWFPDGRRMIANLREISGGARLAVLDTQTGERRVFLEGPDAAISGSISPDSRRLAYSSGDVDIDVVEFDLEGKRGRTLAGSSRIDAGASWSPSGDQFVYVSNSLGPFDLWTKTADGRRSARLGHAPSAKDSGALYGPVYSPDGRRIAYTEGQELRVIPAEGGRSVLTYTGKGRLFTPAWWPDAEFLLIADGSDLLKVPAGGGEARVLARLAFAGESSIRLSRNGNWISYLKPGEGFHLVALNGLEDRFVSHNLDAHASGDFAPDGNSFILTRPAGDNGWELVVVDAATGKEVKVSALDLGAQYEAWSLACHPDGRHVAITTGRLKYDIWMVEGFPSPTHRWMSLFRRWSAVPPGVSER